LRNILNKSEKIQKMRSKKLSKLGRIIWLGVITLWTGIKIQPAIADETKSINFLDSVSLEAKDLLAQGNINLTKITGVRLNQTEEGLEVILETPTGEQLVPLILPEGNNLVIEILDATLALPGESEFRETNPVPGITEISVTRIDNSSIRLTITGEKQAPSAEVVPSQEDLVLSVTPQTTALPEADEEIEVIATGEGEQAGYYVPDATTGTRTDTPIRDIPQSIQVVPRQVIEDQGITRIGDALRNVSGVTPQRDFGNVSDLFNIRGFNNSTTLRNGFRLGTTFGPTVTTAPNVVERIEVLKGPASVLYGQVQPGGVVNFVTKKPLREPFYNLEFTAGNFSFF
jgi:iron complex outermembrane receptor protein